MKYSVILIGYENNTFPVKSFNDYDDAYFYAKEYYYKYQEVIEKMWVRLTIINERGIDIGW